MSEKKSQTTSIILGIVCILLLMGMTGMYFYQNSIIQDKDTIYNNYVSTHSTSNSDAQVNSDYINSHSHTNSEYESIKSDYNNYVASHSHTDSDYNSLSSIANLQASTTWLNDETVNQDRGSYTYYTYTASHAGYVSVQIISSTTSNQYVEAVWSASGVSYDKQITVGTSGTAVFPVLPSSVQIRIGNTNLLNGATATVTITYVY